MLRMNIWQRDYELKLVYDVYPGESVSSVQEEALTRFVNNKKVIEESQNEVEKYCLTENHDEIGLDSFDNIFKYVIPEYIFVKRDGRVAIMCKYKFDKEHGLAVVFKDGKLEKIGKQDIVL